MGTLLDLLWAKTDRSAECWLWRGAVSKGYGRFTYLGVNRQAHRWVYEESIAAIPKGALVLQRCGNHLCVRPEHLYTGDHAESMRLRDQFGRTARGTRHGSMTHPERVISGEDHWDSRFDWETVREIRARNSAGESTRALAAAYGVTQDTIWKITSGRTWKERTQEPGSP